MKYFLLFIFAMIMLILNGCVVMTHRDFDLFKQGWRSVGYVEGIGENNRLWIRTVADLDHALVVCQEKSQ